MRSVLSYPGTMLHAQQIALALHEQGWLKTFVTGFHYSTLGWGDRLLRTLPSSQAAALREQLLRRSIETVPHSLVQAYPAWEILRSVVAKGGAGPVTVDRIWDRMSHRFDATVASRHVPGADAIHAFEYTALASFQRSAREQAARILHLPSLSSRQFENIRRRELARWLLRSGELHGLYLFPDQSADYRLDHSEPEPYPRPVRLCARQPAAGCAGRLSPR